ncbi:MAG TPA: hypothetical protein VGI74_04320 [Streptosporangiaceae bacterium]|jgi:hypothetical protein
MLTTNDEQISAGLNRRVDKVTTRRAVTVMLDGSGLAVQALKYELVVTNPHARSRGRIYIEYGTGHVTWAGAAQEHWGILQGYEYDDGGTGPLVSAEMILDALGADIPAHDVTPARTGTACVTLARVSCADTASGAGRSTRNTRAATPARTFVDGRYRCGPVWGRSGLEGPGPATQAMPLRRNQVADV